MNTEPFKELIAQLPQASYIASEKRDKWLDSIPKSDNPKWHIDRLHGIGGSEIGIAVAHMRKEAHPFKSARQLVREKLLEVPLEPANGPMRRGNLMEPVIQQMFLEDTVPGGESSLQIWNKLDMQLRLSDDAELPQLLQDHPWIKGNPDDIAEIDGKLYIVDYKAPTDVPDSVSMSYEAQVTLYAMKLKAMLEHYEGKQINDIGKLVAFYDHRNSCVQVFEVETDPAFEKEILQAGDVVWNDFVMQGKLPEIEVAKKQREEPPEDLKGKLEGIEKEIMQYKLLADNAYSNLKSLQGQYFKLVNESGIDAVPEVMSVSNRESIIDEQMDSICQTHQIEKSALQKPGKAFDDEKVGKYLAGQGEDPEQFRVMGYDKKKCQQKCEELGLQVPVKNSPSLSIRAGKKLPKEQLAEIKEMASEVLGAASTDLAGRIFEDEDHELPAEIRM